MSQPAGADAPVDQGVVNRMKNAIANTCQHRKKSQHPVVVAQGIAQARQAKQSQTCKKNRARPHPVYKKTRYRLNSTGHNEKNGHQKPQLGIAGAEIVFEPGEQRGQQQLTEMAHHVSQTHQADQLHVLLERGGLGLKFRRNRHGHLPIVARPAGHSGRLIQFDVTKCSPCRRPSIAVPDAGFSQTASD